MLHVTKCAWSFDWLHEHGNEFSLLQWPAQLLYLNPIEYIWDKIAQSVEAMGP